MLIRLEMNQCLGWRTVRKGIYQALPIELVKDVCPNVRNLPCSIVEGDYELSFFFTLRGWQKYGKYFVNLLWRKEGIAEIRKINSPIFVRVVLDEVEKTLIPIYIDEYQKAFNYEDILDIEEEELAINCFYDWRKMEEQFPELA